MRILMEFRFITEICKVIKALVSVQIEKGKENPFSLTQSRVTDVFAFTPRQRDFKF